MDASPQHSQLVARPRRVPARKLLNDFGPVQLGGASLRPVVGSYVLKGFVAYLLLATSYYIATATTCKLPDTASPLKKEKLEKIGK